MSTRGQASTHDGRGGNQQRRNPVLQEAGSEHLGHPERRKPLPPNTPMPSSASSRPTRRRAPGLSPIPRSLKKLFVAVTNSPRPLSSGSLVRDGPVHSTIGEPQRQSILAAGLALQQAGVIPATADVKGGVDSLIDSHYLTASK